MKILLFTITALLFGNLLHAQDPLNLPVKVRHAEPLYADLIRDLGARKGEKEWNAGWASENHDDFVGYTTFIEYEFAPINRLGFEVEVPLKVYHSLSKENETPRSFRNRVEGIKVATQYTFLVSATHQFSVAAGYIHEFRLHSFQTIRSEKSLLKGNEFSPFVVVAKRFGSHIHTLLYTGPEWEKDFDTRLLHGFQLNASVHYMLPSKHFIGIEINEETFDHTTEIIARPQVKLVTASNFAIGFVTGIPVHAQDHGMSFLARVIFEPK